MQLVGRCHVYAGIVGWAGVCCLAVRLIHRSPQPRENINRALSRCCPPTRIRQEPKHCQGEEYSRARLRSSRTQVSWPSLRPRRPIVLSLSGG
ncbi:hypothetical protein BJY04DRAFT_176132 [Aspergillus karnatakaensis]|uniref:uncharacterized protein n=1 Tax=Aspergillus karnatakaensis TaxID=1810916 RepID=UPI003CCE3B82